MVEAHPPRTPSSDHPENRIKKDKPKATKNEAQKTMNSKVIIL